jgi:hypothetical protein
MGVFIFHSTEKRDRFGSSFRKEIDLNTVRSRRIAGVLRSTSAGNEPKDKTPRTGVRMPAVKLGGDARERLKKTGRAERRIV